MVTKQNPSIQLSFFMTLLCGLHCQNIENNMMRTKRCIEIDVGMVLLVVSVGICSRDLQRNIGKMMVLLVHVLHTIQYI